MPLAQILMYVIIIVAIATISQILFRILQVLRTLNNNLVEYMELQRDRASERNG